MRSSVAATCVLLGACSFVPVAATGDGSAPHDARTIDSPPDAPPDALDPMCFGSGDLYFCLATMPTGSHTLPGTVDTARCSGSGFQIATIGTTTVCVFGGATVTAGDSNVIGTLPLVIVSTGDIDETGYIDASSSNGHGDGPGANDPACTRTGIDGGSAGGFGAGGAGGSFGTKGADGANGVSARAGVAGPAMTAPVRTLRGGCPGGDGGAGGDDKADGASGGGALMLVARGTIHLAGTLDASGAGGDGGKHAKGGGGGGGSGGMIVLHGTVVDMPGAIVFANGGGGGGGAGQNDDGHQGDDASLYDSAAAGGPADTAGVTAGGDGGFAATAPTSPTASATGGGGGGGSVGVIRLLGGAQLTNAHVSPPAS